MYQSTPKTGQNQCTIVESTLDSLGVVIVLKDWGGIMSNPNGTYFVESLKDTNENERGYVDYEDVYANMVQWMCWGGRWRNSSSL